jgi:LacI family repressor for deo operon, udp, cdd, tsx, nupC, and nupG
MVLNGRPGPKPETVKLVLEARDRLSAQKLHQAQLARREVCVVGFNMTRNGEVLSPFYGIVLAARHAGIAQNYIPHLFNFDLTPAGFAAFEQVLDSTSFCGVILVGMREPALDIINRRQLPLVIAPFHDPEMRYNCISIDNLNGGRLAGKYFAKFNCRKIALLGSETNPYYSSDRFGGVKLGAPQAEFQHFFFSSDQSPETWQNTMETIIAAGCDALFCANQYSAVNAIRFLRKLNVDIGGRFHVAAFDEAPELAAENITTVSYDSETLGTEAMRMLDNLLSNPDISSQQAKLAAHLIDRGS